MERRKETHRGRRNELINIKKRIAKISQKRKLPFAYTIPSSLGIKANFKGSLREMAFYKRTKRSTGQTCALLAVRIQYSYLLVLYNSIRKSCSCSVPTNSGLILEKLWRALITKTNYRLYDRTKPFFSVSTTRPFRGVEVFKQKTNDKL